MQATSCTETERLDPRVRRTRKLIEEAFQSLLKERAYGEISVGDIADRATINRATFYAHFDDKQHLICSLVRGNMLSALLGSTPPNTPLNAKTLCRFAEILFNFLGQMLGQCPKHEDELTPTIMTTLLDTTQEVLRHWLDLDAKAITAFDGASKDEVATVLAWGIYGSALRWTKLHDRPPADQAARQTIALLMR